MECKDNAMALILEVLEKRGERETKMVTDFRHLTVEFTPMGLAQMVADILCSKITTTTDEKEENTVYIVKCCVERLVEFVGDEAYDFVKKAMKLYRTKLTKE